MTQQRRWRLRRFGTLAVVVPLGAAVLAGCGGGSSDSGASGSAGASGEAAAAANNFSFTFPTATQSASPWQVLADKYTAETGVAIEPRILPNDSYGVTMRTQLQGGNAANLLVVSPGAGQDNAVLPLAEAGFLEPLDAASAAVVPAGTENLLSFDGKLYAQPTDLIPIGMTYNPKAAADSGVQLPANTADLLASCPTLTGAGKSFFAIAGSVPPNPGLMTMAISATRVYADTPDWNQQRADGAVTFADSKGWQDTLQTVLDLNAAGCFQPGAAGGGFDAITAGITQGTSLAAFTPGGAARELMDSTPGLELQVQPFPPAQGGTEFLLASPNYALSIAAAGDAGQKQAAQEFAAWLAKPENAAEFTTLSGGVPITFPETGGALDTQYEPVAELLEAGTYAPLPNLSWPNPGVYDALAKGVQGLIAGQGDVASVLQSVDAAWDR